MNNLGIAWEMLGVGMITVFVILSLVVLIGNLIIRFVNRYLPEEVTKKVQHEAGQATGLDSRKVAAVVSAVNIVTEGRGRVTHIGKL